MQNVKALPLVPSFLYVYSIFYFLDPYMSTQQLIKFTGHCLRVFNLQTVPLHYYTNWLISLLERRCQQ